MARISRTGTTDSTGVASTTVTGSGGGRLKFISRNGGLWSNSCEALDCLFYDEAISNAKASQYATLDNTIEISYSNDGTTITRASETYSSAYYTLLNNSRIWRETDKNYCIECDITYVNDSTVNGSANIVFGGQTIGIYRLNNNSASGNGHLKLITDGETLKPYWNNAHISSQDKTMDLSNLNGFQFNCYRKCEITFKNLKIYPIFSAPKHYTPITLSSSASIIQTGETATLTAELTNVLGEKLASKSVNFIEKFKPTNLYVNDGTDTSTLTIPSGASVTVEDGALKMTTSTTGEKTIAYNYDLNNSDNFLFECEIAKLGTSQSIAMYVKNSTTATGCWFSYENSTNKWGGGILGSTFSNVDTGTLAVGDKIKIKQLNGVITLYHNDAVIYSKTANLGSNFKIGHYTNNGRIQYIKNIKLTDWAEDTLIGTGTTNSQGIATCNNTITGTGKGERQFIASNSSIQSNTYEVLDCIWFDIATTGKKSSAWSNPDNITITTTDDGTTLSQVANYYSATTVMTGDFRLEFEVKTTGGNGRFGIYVSNLSKSCNLNIKETNWVYFRITRQNGVSTLERSSDSVTWTTGSWGSNTLTTEDCYFKFYNLATDRTISYRNLKAYPI